MRLKTMSATAAEMYENCPARYRAMYSGERPQEVASAAADLGTAVHGALERAVGLNAFPIETETVLAFFDDEYWKLFADRAQYDDGVDMLRRWCARQDWTNRTVLSTEIKESFPIKTSEGEVPFNYIWDRCDKIDNGDGTFDIEVVDYKTFRRPVQPEDLVNKIQPRAYSVAARIKFPEARNIWITYDLLRFDQIGRKFSRDDDVTTFKYLKNLAERIIADKNPIERVNPDCRWCIRKTVCRALQAHANAGGILGVDVHRAADLRRQMKDQIAGLESLVNELDNYLLSEMEAQDVLELRTETTVVTADASKKRVIDPARAADVIGAELVAKYGSLTMKSVDALLKGNEINDEQKNALKKLISYQYSAPSIKTVAVAKK